MQNNYKKIGIIEIIIAVNVILFIPWFLRFFGFTGLLNTFIGYLGLIVNVDKLKMVNNILPSVYIPSVEHGAIWQLLTSMFLHGGVWHILFNMYALYAFGKPLEYKWGKTQFLLFYLIVGVLANVGTVILFLLIGEPIIAIGASGAIFGVLLAYASYSPDSKVLLFFFIPMKVKWAILIFAGLELILGMTNSFNISFLQKIGHATHLFGFVAAYLYLLIYYKINPIKEMFFSNRRYYN